MVTISIHALREEGDNSPTTPTTKPRNFYPRPPRGGRRHVAPDGPRHAVISIHALREEGDAELCRRHEGPFRFLSTPSARRATAAVRQQSRGDAISIHALREEGDPGRCPHRLRSSPISIHALREEGDSFLSPFAWTWRNFYPRPPRGGRRGGEYRMSDRHIFLSTPSARRATHPFTTPASSAIYFYPRPPRGGRLAGHAAGVVPLADFYPRPPRGGRRDQNHKDIRRYVISIHALREEGDSPGNITTAGESNFYPRPPRGGRRASMLRTSRCGYFYPRPPRGGRHAAHPPLLRIHAISIHALREEGDGKSIPNGKIPKDFYPRGGRPAGIVKRLCKLLISIHALREEGDRYL